MTNKIFPDLVIKFHGDVDLLHSRRPEMNREDLAAKQEGILKLKFTNKTKIVKIEIEDRIDTIKSKIIHEISTLITEKSM